MARVTKRRVVEIRGKPVTFSERRLASGEVALYRAGKRVDTPYQRRLARGVLRGLSPAEATGRKDAVTRAARRRFRRQYGDRFVSAQEADEADPFLASWAADPFTAPVGEPRQFYVKLRVLVSASGNRSDLEPDDVDPDKTAEATLPLFRQTADGRLVGLTSDELARGFPSLLQQAIDRSGVLPVEEDPVVGIWRHKRR